MISATSANGLKRVVITGVGAISPLGLSINESWQNALNGKSGVDTITKFDASALDVRIAAEVKNYNADLAIDKKEQKKMDLFIQYALSATKEALEQSALVIDDTNAERIGVFIGTGMGGLPGIEEQHKKLLDRGPGRVSPFFIPSVITNLAPGWISMIHGTRGPNYTVTSACASGVHALGDAYNQIRLGLIDAAITGGSESTVCPLSIVGFSNMRALSSRNEAPQKASRPWDKDRDGFVLGEGAAILILESLESALKRDAPILCEVTGYAASSDAYHITSPDPSGRGFIQVMTQALKSASLNPSDIFYINAHGTSTPTGDPLEAGAISKIMNSHVEKLWVSSTKSMTGHLLGAAGALESVFCVQSLVTQSVAPTINLDNRSEDCNLDFVPHVARSTEGRMKHVMNNSFGFGGTNATVIFSTFNK